MANVDPSSVNPYAAPRAAVAEPAEEYHPVKLFSVAGRIGRARYITYGLGMYILIGILGGALSAVAGTVGQLLSFIAILAVVFMLTIQRCHDFNTTGWLSLLVLIPIVNLLFWFIPGSDGANRYGAPTPPNSVLTLVLVWFFPVVAVVGILAAVALPAYQQSVKRAQQVQPQQR